MASSTDSVDISYGADKLTLKTGVLAQQASGSITVRHGETVVLVTATVSANPREGADFFPLTVDFEERMYAAGKISGSKFIKRENRPSEAAILRSRLADRAIRPMFPKSFRREVQIIATILSYDEEHDPGEMAIVGASAALLQTDAPFAGPVGAVRVGLIEGEFVLNPTDTQLENSQLDLVVAGTAERVTMIEAGAKEVPEGKVLEALKFAHQAIKDTLEPQKNFIAKDKESANYEEPAHFQEIAQWGKTKLDELVRQTDLAKRSEGLVALKKEATENFTEQYGEAELSQAVDYAFFKAIRHLVLDEGIRPDGRAMDEIRPLSAKVNILPRVHGSALFNRGETQALTVTTLGSPGQEQWIDTMEEFSRKRYMHHYNFPPYATGEVKMLRGSGRREIGHGALAEKALVPVIPAKEDFPYTIRLVSEILSSNGSSSMAAVVGSTLSLMDAGVPISKPVAGVAMGLVGDEELKKYHILTDLQGLEDFAGEMDFKIAGTVDGITAIQLDVKNKGLTEEVVQGTLTAAKAGRLKILEMMAQTLEKPRSELSAYAPRIISTHIDPTKIGELIGPGGKTINKIVDSVGGREIVSVDIEDDGTVMITSADADKANIVRQAVESIGVPLQVGQEFTGAITQIVKDKNSGKEIGAIVQLTPNKDGMIHISALGTGEFVAKVSDIVKVGDEVKVKITAIDEERGRISLTKLS